MADLHEALKSLSPIDWDDIPKDDLPSFVQQLVEDSDVICNSIPSLPEGTPFEQTTRQTLQPGTAQRATETGPSNARAPAPHPHHEALHSSWGKPMKFSAKDNPLHVSVYKMAGRDRHGAWFARRSVHEGIGFNKFRTAMLREFPQTLTVQGSAGAGSIRGIGGDRRLERIDVGESSRLEVYQLSAQFPGPTTPREFITLLVVDQKPTTYSTQEVGRQLMVISKPVSHPDAPERPGYIRGQYESVELIREIPISRIISQSTPSLPLPSAKPVGSGESKLSRSMTDFQDGTSLQQKPQDPQAERNPVEWTMITRSDPGGGIPRFMVDRGTPSTMLGDIAKFLDWAVKVSEHESPDVDLKPEGTEVTASKEPVQHDVAHPPPSYSPAEDTTTAHDDKQGGVFQGLTNALEAGLDAYAPTMVSSFVHDRLHRPVSSDSTSDSSDASSAASFASAADTHDHAILAAASDERSLTSETVSIQSGLKKDGGGSGHPRDKQHEKELQKISEAQEKLEQRLAKKREEEKERLKKSQEDEQSESSKALERHDKEIKKQEERHEKEMAKLHSKREREVKKFEDKMRKQNDRDAMSKVTRERDDFRTQVDLLKRENDVLRKRIENLEQMDTGKGAEA